MEKELPSQSSEHTDLMGWQRLFQGLIKTSGVTTGMMLQRNTLHFDFTIMFFSSGKSP